MPDGSSSAAPVTSPGPSSRSTIFQEFLISDFQGVLISERLVSVMKFFDARDQLKRLSPCVRHSRFLAGNQEHSRSASALRQTRTEFCAAPALTIIMRSNNSSQPS